MRYYHWIIRENEGGAVMRNAVRRALPLLPASAVREAFARRDVRLNGRRIGPEEAAIPGAGAELWTDAETGLERVYEDGRILVINKPAGLCVEDEGAGMTVMTLAEQYASGAYQPRLCHRLDTRTSGLLVLAKDRESEQAMVQAFHDRTPEKIYQCIVKGKPQPENGLFSAYLVKNSEAGRVRIVSHHTPGSLEIRTEYDTLRTGTGMSLVRVRLITGRTHQIRAHMAYLNHPILGDDVYGDRNWNRKMKCTDLKLCAVELTFHFEKSAELSYLNGIPMRIHAPFEKMLDISSNP